MSRMSTQLIIYHRLKHKVDKYVNITLCCVFLRKSQLHLLDEIYITTPCWITLKLH